MSTILFANNATTTLAGAISNVATTCAVASGTGVEFPSPGAGQYFVMTFNDAATGLLDEIVWVTNVSGDTLTIVRGQEGTTALAWNAGDLASNFVTAGTMSALLQQSNARIKLTANQNFFINAGTGNDSNTGLSSGSPWLTRQHAQNYVQANYDLAGFNVTFNCVGAFTDALIVAGPMTGQTNSNGVVWLGSVGSPGSVTVATTSSPCFQFVTGAKAFVSGFQLSSTLNNAILTSDPGTAVIYGSIIFGSCPSGSHVNQTTGSECYPVQNYTISGGAANHIFSGNGGIFQILSSIVVTLTGTPAFSGAFVNAFGNGTVFAPSSLLSFSGSATGVRYSATLNGVINTQGGGATFFPGGTSGSLATGGQYA